MENQAGIENSALLIDAAMRARLAALYSAPGRHYHGLAHVEALLALAERHRAAIADFAALEAAIWFHDAIYDSRRQDNEARSAALAREWLAGRAEPERLDRIAAMIEATRTHRLPDGEDTAARGDAALLLDMDLSILAAPEAAFDAYERAVRLEYGWVDDDTWRAGRAAVLQGFLSRPRIFHSDPFFAECEAAARRNLTRALARLG